VPSKGGFRPATRARVSEDIFEQLAAAILDGELAPGTALPSERILAERLATSRILIRQAVHRLADLGLLRVKQGGATLVLDPAEAADVRAIELLYRHRKSGRARSEAALPAGDILDKQLLQGLCLVQLAELRASREQRARVVALVEEWATSPDPEAGWDAFDEKFWRLLAEAWQNRIFRMEVAWWYRVFADREALAEAGAVRPSPLAIRVAFHRELGRRLAQRDGAAAFYQAVIAPILMTTRRSG